MIDLLSTQETREVLKWACGFVGSPEVNHCRKWRPHEYDACRAVSDPAELAKMWSAEIERLQLDIPSERAHGSWYSVSSYLVDGIEIAKYGWVSQVKPMTDSTRSHWKWSFPGHRSFRSSKPVRSLPFGLRSKMAIVKLPSRL